MLENSTKHNRHIPHNWYHLSNPSERMRFIRKILLYLVTIFTFSGCTFLQHASFHEPSIASPTITTKQLGDGIVFKTNDLCIRISHIGNGSNTYRQILAGPYYLPFFPVFLNPFQWLSRVEWYEDRHWITVDLEPREVSMKINIKDIRLVYATGEYRAPDIFAPWYLYKSQGGFMEINETTESLLIPYGNNAATPDFSKKIEHEPSLGKIFIGRPPPPDYKKVHPPKVTRITLGFMKPFEEADPNHLIINGVQKSESPVSFPSINFAFHEKLRFQHGNPGDPDGIPPDAFLYGVCPHTD